MSKARLVKRAAVTLAMLALGTGGALSAAPGAYAETFNGVCDSGEICVFKNAGQTGGMVDFPRGNDTHYGDNVFRPVGGNANDNVSSTRNRTNRSVRYHKDDGCSGVNIFEESNGHHDNLAQDGLNDAISSHCLA